MKSAWPNEVGRTGEDRVETVLESATTDGHTGEDGVEKVQQEGFLALRRKAWDDDSK